MKLKTIAFPIPQRLMPPLMIESSLGSLNSLDGPVRNDPIERRKSPIRMKSTLLVEWGKNSIGTVTRTTITVKWKKNSPAILLWREYEGRRYFCIAFWKILILFNGINQRREELLRWNHSLGWVVKDQGNKQGSSSGSAQSWSPQNLRVSQGGSALAYWREVTRNDWPPS